MPEVETAGDRADLRMPALGLAAWVAGLLALAPVGWGAAGLGSVATLGLVIARRVPGSGRTVAAAGLVAAGVLTSAVLRQEAVLESPVAHLAAEGAAVDVTAVVTADPRLVSGRFGDQVLVRVEVLEVTGRGAVHRLRVPLLVIGTEEWLAVPLGATLATTGRLSPSDERELAGVLHGASTPRIRDGPGPWWRAAGAVRASVRDSVAGRPDDQRALVPAIVDGDETGLDADLTDDFKVTGLTHLTAVSGTNLTLLVGFLLVLARWAGVRGRWLVLVAACGIVGFLLVARGEPSVLRAAAMGGVGLLALGSNGRQRAFRGLGVAMVGLLLVQPTLATSVGFALSVLATAGIVIWAPGWRDTMSHWLPRWLAEAIAVPAAAQLACTPVIAAISGQVSLVAIPANLLVAPVVGPATVLGLAGGLLGLVAPALGSACGWAAGWCVAWIVLVARRGADLPVPQVAWGSDGWSLVLLVAVCAVVALATPFLVRRAVTALPLAMLLVVVITVRLPTPGWPADGWAVAMCDVGQGDAIVLRAGPRSGVLVDAGPDPELVDRCLSDLGVDRLPLVVLTHFHADHVDGLSGALRGREVGAIWTTSLLDPPAAVDGVVALAEQQGVTPTLPSYGATQVGEVTLQTVWPEPGPPHPGPGDGSTANDASVVLVAEVGGVRVLLTGDVEPPGQERLAAAYPGLQVDVLKVPHHGSRYQDLDWLCSLGASEALVSVGADNDYGHPSPDTVAGLQACGADVHRADEDGALTVAPSGAGVTVVGR